MADAGSPLALVTGASGFVGSHLVEALLERGWRVRVLLRATSSRRWLPEDRVETAQGTVTDPSGLPAAAAGVDTVFHLAGTMFAGDEAEYMRVNARGAGHLAEAARDHAPALRRFVLASSLAAGGPSPDAGTPRTEAHPDRPSGPYGRSKLAGEKEVAAVLPGRWTAVRPPGIYGPRDTGFLRLFSLVARGMAPRFTGAPQPMSVIHIDDLCRGMLLAAERDAAVDRAFYLAHPRPTDLEEMGRLAATALGRSYRGIKVPKPVLSPLSRLVGVGASLVGRSNPLPPDRVDDLNQPAWTCSPELAERELGFEARRDLRREVAATASWYRDEGWL